LPAGHDDLGRRLDGVLHAPAVGDDPGAGGARFVRAQALPARHAAQARSRAGRRVTNKVVVSNLAAITVRGRPVQLRLDASIFGPSCLGRVSGLGGAASPSLAPPMQARPRNATLLPSRSLIHPASVVLSEAPIPIPLPTIPCARLKRPVPRVMSA